MWESDMKLSRFFSISVLGLEPTHRFGSQWPSLCGLTLDQQRSGGAGLVGGHLLLEILRSTGGDILRPEGLYYPVQRKG